MALLIYVPPALLTSAAVKSKYHHLYTQKYGVSNILSMWLFMLGSCISLNLMLGYVACLHIMSISTVYFLGNAIHDYMTHRAPRFGYDRSKLIQSAVFYHYEICQIPILYIWWSVFSPTFTMLIPLMGKTGTIIPSDTLISIVIGIGVLTGWNSLFPYSIRPAKSYKNMWIGYVILIFILGISIRPYSDLHPKRLWIQHVYKESHQSSSDAGKSSSIHHGLWVSAFDAAGLDPIIPYIKSAYHRNQFFPNVGNLMSVINDNTPWSQFEYSCNGWSGDCYFHYPYSYPVAEVLQDFIFIPLEESSEIIMTPNKLTLDISTILSNPLAYQEIPTTNHYLRTLPKDSRLIKKILSISVTGSSHMTLVVRELAGSHLLRSTFCREGADLPSDDDWHDSSVVNRPDGVYYIQIGFGMCPENVCRQQVYFEVCDESKESKLQIAAYSHYMEGKDEMIRKFIKELPDWSQGAEWSQYQSHMIVKYA